MPENIAITSIIRQRFSCRTFLNSPINSEKQFQLNNFIKNLQSGPFGNQANFHLIVSHSEDNKTLSDLGTYGFIKDPAGFIIGSVRQNIKNLEDFGFQMEKIILYATSINLGTCWLGGSFTRSSFAKKINITDNEIIPAVTAIGEIIDSEQARKGLIRKQINADKRLLWEKLFFYNNFSNPLPLEVADVWAHPLQMVRLGPSASNKQPWRIIYKDNTWHFYLQRTKGYQESILTRFLGVADMQRVDMGIAMCHFELTAQENNLPGKWEILDPHLDRPDSFTEYLVSWIP